MSVNTLEYAEVFQEMLDEQMVQESTTAWMEPNAEMVRYNGGNTIRIPKILTEGLGDYNRSTGFPDGAVSLEFETHTFDKDRGKEFNLDSQDVDETNFALTAGNVMGEFQRTQVIPEVDSYRYSRIFNYANLGGKLRSYTPDSSTIFQQLKADIVAVRDITGESEQLVIAMPFGVASILEDSTSLSKELRVDNFEVGTGANGKAIETRVSFLDNIPIMKVSSARMKSLYTYSATNGYAPNANALDLNWLIMSRRSVLGVVKTDKIRIFTPDENQSLDAWKLQVRKYHTLWVPDNKVSGIFASYAPATAPALSITVAGGTASGSTKYTATPTGANTLAYKITVGAAATDLSYGIVPTGITAYTSGADIAGVSADEYLNAYELDAEGKVVTSVSYVLQAGDITA